MTTKRILPGYGAVQETTSHKIVSPLGAGRQETAGSTVPVFFTGGPVPDQVGTVGSLFTPLQLSLYFSGSETPFTYSQSAGTAVSTVGLSLNTSTGEISGTPNTDAVLSNVQFTATDQALNSAQTNAFDITIVPAPGGGGIIIVTFSD